MLQKAAEQIKDANGDVTDTVEYAVTINPAKKDLDKNSENLELTDKLTTDNNTEASLDLSTVKLYKYDATAANKRGAEENSNVYHVTGYDARTHTMTIQIPDKAAYVLVYR